MGCLRSTLVLEAKPPGNYKVCLMQSYWPPQPSRKHHFPGTTALTCRAQSLDWERLSACWVPPSEMVPTTPRATIACVLHRRTDNGAELSFTYPDPEQY